MDSLKLGAGETLVISKDAVHKKEPGRVWFTTHRVLWVATDAKAAVQRVELMWAAVKKFQCSPASEPRALLRLQQHAAGESPIILRFPGSTPGETPREALEQARAAVARGMRGDGRSATEGGGEAGAKSETGALGKGKRKSKELDGGVPKKTKWKTNRRQGVLGSASGGQPLRLSNGDTMPGGVMRDGHDGKQRAGLLAGDDVLAAQYKEMVEGGVITDEARARPTGRPDYSEFWESRKRTLAGEEAKATSRHTGAPSEMPSNLEAETTSDGMLKFKLNARTIHSIFTMYPIVFK
ncbi:unnamed protein product [Discosporangium mesarthrocarpum]